MIRQLRGHPRNPPMIESELFGHEKRGLYWRHRGRKPGLWSRRRRRYRCFWMGDLVELPLEAQAAVTLLQEGEIRGWLGASHKGQCAPGGSHAQGSWRSLWPPGPVSRKICFIRLNVDRMRLPRSTRAVAKTFHVDRPGMLAPRGRQDEPAGHALYPGREDAHPPAYPGQATCGS